MPRVKTAFLLFSTILCAVGAEAQIVSPWQIYLSRQQTTQVTIGESKVFALGDGALYSLSRKNTSEVETYDKLNGLSDTGITYLHYSPEAKTLILYYQSGNIDLMTPKGIQQIATLSTSPIIGNKQINQITSYGSTAYLAGEFGVAELCLQDQLIRETYLPQHSVTSVCLSPDEQEIWACYEGELHYASTSNNLKDPNSWSLLDLSSYTSSRWKQIGFAGNQLIGIDNSGQLFLIHRDVAPTMITPAQTDQFVDLRTKGAELLVEGKETALIIRSDLSLEQVNKNGGVDIDLNPATQEIWIASGKQGLNRLRKQASSWDAEEFSHTFNAPADNSYYSLRTSGGWLYSVNGGRSTDRFRQEGSIKLFDGRHWQNIHRDDLVYTDNYPLTDPVDIIPDRSNDPLHYYVATWGEGLYEIQGKRVINRFDTHNSALSSALPNQSHYTRVSSLCYDGIGNLWMALGLTNESSGGSLVRLGTNRSWQSYHYPQIHNTNAFGPMVIFPNGVKWIADFHLAQHGEGVSIINDRGTIPTEDDALAHFNSFRERSGRAYPISKINAMVVDRTGLLWLGSNRGYCSVVNPSETPNPSTPPTVIRPTSGEESDQYYVLDNIAVSAIAIDNLNRKWIGTAESGLYLISTDGTEIIRHFTAENSPLLSNKIQSLAFEERSGKLFISSPLGLNSYNTGSGDLTSSGSTVIAFPNPLRPEHPNSITFSGLSAGASIRITNNIGSIVYEAITEGTIHRWDTTTSQGTRLPSGVYTAQIYPRDGGKPIRLSVAIIRD